MRARWAKSILIPALIPGSMLPVIGMAQSTGGDNAVRPAALGEAAPCGAETDLRLGAVFTLLNVPPENQVLALGRAGDGSLCVAGSYRTGGASDRLGATVSGQNGIVVADGYVFATNPGISASTSNGSLSVFRIEKDRLILTDVQASGGLNPRSVTRLGDLVYVVNAGSGRPGAASAPRPRTRILFARRQAGDAGIAQAQQDRENIQGFRFDPTTGTLSPLPGSSVATIDGAGDPAQIGFTPDGRHLVVSQRRVNGVIFTGEEARYLEVFNVDADGLPTDVVQSDVGGDAPFGFQISDDNTVYLTHGLVPDTVDSGLSAHRIHEDGTLTTLTPYTRDGAAETCWNFLSTATGTPYLYTSASFDSAVGLSRINADGSLTLVNSKLASSAASDQNRLVTDQGGVDMHGAVDAGGQEYLYVLNNPYFTPLPDYRVASIVGFRINADDGTLQKMGASLASGITNNGFGLWAQ